MEWFKNWFNSPYYHILYKDRDDAEAIMFIDHLIDHLSPAAGCCMLDLACGRGRHAKYLATKGFDVTGIDLSMQNITSAMEYENENLHFHVHDMRETFEAHKFDFIFNFFTSFGYFDEDENLQVIKAIEESLKANGVFVIDFLNPYNVIINLSKEELIEIEGIRFFVDRYLKDNRIIKRIRFNHSEEDHEFEEDIQAISKEDFEQLFDNTSLEITSIFGDYELNDYIPESSDRMIIIARKK